MIPAPMLILLLALVGATVSVPHDSYCGELSTCEECISPVCSWDVKEQTCNEVSKFDFLNKCKINAKSDCPWKIEEKYAYNDSFARYVMFRLAGAANSQHPEKCLGKISSEIESINQMVIPCTDIFSTCSVTTALWRQKEAILIGFRSSTSATQLVAQFISGLAETTPFESGGRVSTYYELIFRKIWDSGLHDEIVKLLKDYPSYELYLTGASQAGTLATLTAHVLVAKNITKGEKIKLITFGEPRVYDREFSEAHDRMLPYTYRVVIGHDTVPHFGPKGHMDYHHHRYEVWYNNKMKPNDTYKICYSPEDCQCSLSVANVDLLAHIGYFGVDPFTFTFNDCDLP